MREKQIESKLSMAGKKRGGLCEKLNTGTAGWPDRIILMPDGKIAFAELKAPGKKPRPLQLARHKSLMELGFRVFVIDSVEQIGEIIDEIQST